MSAPATAAAAIVRQARDISRCMGRRGERVNGPGYDRLGVIGIVAMLVHATGDPAFSAACSGGSSGSQWTPRNRRPVTFPAASETSQRRGGAMTSGWIILARSKPEADTIGVFVIPPGTRTLTVTPVPSRSFAMIALSASSAALEGP